MATKKQKQKLEQCTQCACFNLRKATRAVTQLYDRAFQPYSLRATQFQILVAIANRGPIAISNLAGKLVMDRTTLSRDLGPLERKGWIKVEPGKDRRTRSAALTAEGWRLLRDAFPAWKQTQEDVVKALGLESFAVLLKELSSVTMAARSGGQAT